MLGARHALSSTQDISLPSRSYMCSHSMEEHFAINPPNGVMGSKRSQNMLDCLGIASILHYTAALRFHIMLQLINSSVSINQDNYSVHMAMPDEAKEEIPVLHECISKSEGFRNSSCAFYQDTASWASEDPSVDSLTQPWKVLGIIIDYL